jgi:hypothetical protein
MGTVRKHGNINLPAACSYLAHVQLDRLDAVAQLVDECLEDLGLEPDAKAVKLQETNAAQPPTGNIRGIIQYLENIPEAAATAEDKKAVQAIHAVVHGRVSAAKYKPKQALDDEGKPNRIRKKPARKGPRARRRAAAVANPQPGGVTAEGKKPKRQR